MISVLETNEELQSRLTRYKQEYNSSNSNTSTAAMEALFNLIDELQIQLLNYTTGLKQRVEQCCSIGNPVLRKRISKNIETENLAYQAAMRKNLKDFQATIRDSGGISTDLEQVMFDLSETVMTVTADAIKKATLKLMLSKV